MKWLLLLSVFIISAIILFCTEFDKTVSPVDSSESGALSMTVHAGTIGALAKTAAIEMSLLYVQLSSPGLPTIYDTLLLSGGSAERTERKTYTNLASRVRNSIVQWTLAVESRDQNGTVIHSGDTVFSVPPSDTINIEMFLAAQYSMLVANFYPIRDSVTGCEIKVDGIIKNSVSFEKQSRLGDTISLTYDYLQASPLGISQNIKMNVYGKYWGTDTLLYTGDTTITIVSGRSDNYKLKLKCVGPAVLKGAATMVVSLGAVGTVTVDGELEDNKRIVYAALNGTGGWNIYSMNSDGSDAVNLTKSLSNNVYPCWTPDKKEIVFSSDRDGDYEIFIMNRNGDNLRQLTSNAISDGSPVVSPDGNRIMWQQSSGSYCDLFMMNIDGTNMENITNTPSLNEFHPAWHPTMQKILYVIDDPFNYYRGDIFIAGYNNSERTRLTQDDGRFDLSSQRPFTIDGNTIVYGAFINFGEGMDGIYKMNLDGTNKTKIPSLPKVDYWDNSMPVVSSIDNSILFRHVVNGKWQIYSMTLSGTDIVKLTSDSLDAGGTGYDW